MTIERKTLRWNGWGWNEAPDLLGEREAAAWKWIGGELNAAPLQETPPAALEAVSVPASRIEDSVRTRLAEIVGADQVRVDDYERVFHAKGRSYNDLLHLRSGTLEAAPDVVVYPRDEEQVLAVLALCEAEHLAVVPFGAGSSVVGGVDGRAIGFNAVVTIDMTLMDQILEIDEEALVARIQSGVYGPALEKQLQEKGYTLGHFPQSFEFSTLGGWIGHRGAGQQSNRYGKAEKWFVGARVATPRGLWQTEAFPASAAGPQLNALVVGSEGVLGIITEATVRIHRVAEKKDYRGFLFMDWEAAVSAAREHAQEDVPTAMIRLSDPDESHFYQTLKTVGEDDAPTIRFCAMIVGIEGSAGEVDAAVARSRAICDRHGGMHLGEEPGQKWFENRFGMPYLRDPMMDRGLGVDTLETCTRWSSIVPLHAKLHEALSTALEQHPGRPGTKGIVMAHVSHCYRDGASLYFTFVFVRDPENPAAQWQTIKTIASDTILANGGTISHHHGVGIDHLPWMEREKGTVGMALLRQLKAELDPNGIMNPGKLIG